MGFQNPESEGDSLVGSAQCGGRKHCKIDVKQWL